MGRWQAAFGGLLQSNEESLDADFLFVQCVNGERLGIFLAQRNLAQAEFYHLVILVAAAMMLLVQQQFCNAL